MKCLADQFHQISKQQRLTRNTLKIKGIAYSKIPKFFSVFYYPKNLSNFVSPNNIKVQKLYLFHNLLIIKKRDKTIQEKHHNQKKYRELTMEKHIELWEKCLTIIRDNISETAYKTWFELVKPVRYENYEFLVEVPSTFFYEYIEEHYSQLLRFTLNKIIGENTILLYKVTVNKENKEKGSTVIPTTAHNEKAIKNPTITNQAANPFNQIEREDIDPRINPAYNFFSYVEGSSNKLARCAGLQIAEEPGNSIFNPMFVYGKSGVGKTHLANAIGIQTKQIHPNKRVLYVSANLFQIQFTDACRRGSINDFLLFYQSIDVLIIDDIQELIGKTKTQNTFFNIFNHLHIMGKQLILISDRDPNQLEGMEERLITRFKSGLTVEIEKPTLELRKAILKNKIYQDGLTIEDDVVEYIAQNVSDNIRNLEGVLISILAHSTLIDAEINIALAEKIIGKILKHDDHKNVSLTDIQNIVCNYFKVPADMLSSKSRKREIAEPRQIVMYLARTHTNTALASIGAALGNRDHSTVLHACKSIKDQMDINKDFLQTIHMLEKKLYEK